MLEDGSVGSIFVLGVGGAGEDGRVGADKTLCDGC